MTARGDADKIQIDGEDYVSFGYFDPLIGRRVINRLFQNHVRFIARDATRLGVSSEAIVDHVSWRDEYRVLAKISRIELFIRSEDQDRARQLIDET